MTAVGDDADGRYLAGIAPGLLLDGSYYLLLNIRELVPTYT